MEFGRIVDQQWRYFTGNQCMISRIIMHSKNCCKIAGFFGVPQENPVLSRL